MSTTTAVTSLVGFHVTPAAQRSDELVRAFFDAVNADNPARTDAVLARSFLSCDVHGTRSRTGLKRYLADLRRSFTGRRFQVHENVGVLVEGDLVALRTLITGTHSGDYAGPSPNPKPWQGSHDIRCATAKCAQERMTGGRTHRDKLVHSYPVSRKEEP